MIRGRRTFYVVIGPGIENSRHATIESAEAEAKNQAIIAPGGEFTVMESIISFVKADVAWIHHDPEAIENLPF